MASRPTLIFRIYPDGSTRWCWAEDASMAGAPSAEAVDKATETVVLVPGEDVLVTQVQLPVSDRSRLRQAAPFAVEEMVVGPIDQQHVAVGRQRDGQVELAVVSQAILHHWQDIWQQAGLTPDRVLPDSLVLPQVGKVAEDGRLLARTADQALAGPVDGIAELPQIRSLESIAQVPDDVTAWLAAQGRLDSVNLLQGDWLPRARRQQGKRPWRVAAGLAALLVVLAGMSLAWEHQRISSAVDDRQTRMTNIFQTTFPNTTRIGDDRAQMQQKLAQLRSSRGMTGPDTVLAMLQQTGPVLASDRGVVLQSMDYRAGLLNLSLTAPTLARLESLRGKLAALPQMQVQMTSVTTQDDGVSARLELTLGAGSSNLAANSGADAG